MYTFTFGVILYCLVIALLIFIGIRALIFITKFTFSPKFRMRRRMNKIIQLDDAAFISEKLNDMKSFKRQRKIGIANMKDKNSEFRNQKRRENLLDKNNNIKVSLKSKFQATHANRILRNFLGKKQVEQSIVRNVR